MSRREAVLWRQVVDDLANALQVAIGRATAVRRTAQTMTDDAVLLESSIGRAVAALKRLQPRPSPGRDRR